MSRLPSLAFGLGFAYSMYENWGTNTTGSIFCSVLSLLFSAVVVSSLMQIAFVRNVPYFSATFDLNFFWCFDVCELLFWISEHCCELVDCVRGDVRLVPLRRVWFRFVLCRMNRLILFFWSL
jgi:hypothetical protein